MKDWNTIGKFALKVGLSKKALRLYEKLGLLQSSCRGENKYRYHHNDQIVPALKLKEFRSVGFSLIEIKALMPVLKLLKKVEFFTFQKTKGFNHKLKRLVVL